MASFNAFGEYPPPMIIFPGERIRDVGLSEFPDTIYSTTPNGWMDSAAFLEYVKQIDAIVDNKGIRKPIILFVDGHSAHICLETSQYCKDRNIILYCLLPNATHLLQAANIGLFAPLKSSWVPAVKAWQMENVGMAVWYVPLRREWN